MNRVDRLTAILNLLQSSSKVKIKTVANRFGISNRTVYRDLDALVKIGIPLAGDGYEGYSLVEGYKLPPLMFTQAEALAFLAAQQLVGRYTDDSFRRNYDTGIDKIKAVMQRAGKDNINALSQVIASRNFNHPFQGNDNINTIIQQIIGNKRIQILYFSFHSQQETCREIDPIGIFFSQANWYLVAFCHQKQDYRTFHIKRIKNILPLEIKISKKHPPLDFFLKNKGSGYKMQKVILKVAKEQFSIMGEERYYQGLIEESECEDKIELHFMTFSIPQFARWYLSYADIATIIYPDELKQAALNLKNKTLL